jgi:hypothetical protein
MAHITRKLVVVVLVLVGAGMAAAATSPVIVGPSAGISSPTSPLAQITPSTSTNQSTSGGVTSTTVGDSTTVTGSGSSTTTPGSTTPSTTVPGTPVAIEQIVSLTRTVEVGAPVSAFGVPAGNRLVVTDVVITNPGTAPACGAGIGAGAATVSGATDAAGTGVLCVPAQTSLTLALTTGLEFASGQSVVLSNRAVAGGTTTSGGQLFYHLRGFLISGV